MLTKLVSTATGGDEKRKPISAPSIQNGALVGAGLLWQGHKGRPVGGGQ